MWDRGEKGKKTQRNVYFGFGPPRDFVFGWLPGIFCLYPETPKYVLIRIHHAAIEELRELNMGQSSFNAPVEKEGFEYMGCCARRVFFNKGVCVCVFYFIYFFLSGFYFESELMGINYFLWILFDCDFLVFVSVF